MSDDAQNAAAYRVPTYRAPSGTVFYHFLHGHVPNHQIDFIYRPEIPQGPLLQQHFSHLSRLVKYIEPQPNNSFAFAIGNLSRDDTQHEPGHGGVGLIFSMRVSGVTDHAGRKDPTFAHAAALIGRHLDERILFEALASFYSHLFSRSEDTSASALMYRKYVNAARSDAGAALEVLRGYVKDFDDLPRCLPSTMQSRWSANEAAQPKRVVIVHPNQIRFRHVAQCASRIAAMLYASNIRWTSITNGREADLENGITVRMVSEADAAAFTSNAMVLGLADVPAKEEEIAEKVFGAKPVNRASEAAPAMGWRARYEAERGVAAGGESGSGEEAQEPAAMPDSGSKRDRRVMKEALRSSHAEVMEGREGHEGKDAKEETIPSDRAAGAGAIPPPVVPVEAGQEAKRAEPEVQAERAKAEKKEPAQRSSRTGIWLGLAVVLMGVLGAVIFAMGGGGDGGVREGSGNPGTGEKAPGTTPVPKEPNSGAAKPKEPVPAQVKTAEPPVELKTAQPEPTLPEEPPGSETPGKKAGGKKGKKPIGTAIAETATVAPLSEEPPPKPTVEAPKPTVTAKPTNTSIIDTTKPVF